MGWCLGWVDNLTLGRVDGMAGGQSAAVSLNPFLVVVACDALIVKSLLTASTMSSWANRRWHGRCLRKDWDEIHLGGHVYLAQTYSQRRVSLCPRCFLVSIVVR